MFCAYTTPLHIRDLTFQEGLVPVVPEVNPPPVQRDDQLQTFGLFHDGGCSLVSSGSLWLSCPTLWDQGLSRYSMNSELTILTGVLLLGMSKGSRTIGPSVRLKPPSLSLLRGSAWSLHPEATQDHSGIVLSV